MTYNHITVGEGRGHVSTPNAKIMGLKFWWDQPLWLRWQSRPGVLSVHGDLVLHTQVGDCRIRGEEPAETLDLEAGEMLLLLS